MRKAMHTAGYVALAFACLGCNEIFDLRAAETRQESGAVACPGPNDVRYDINGSFEDWTTSNPVGWEAQGSGTIEKVAGNGDATALRLHVPSLKYGDVLNKMQQISVKVGDKIWLHGSGRIVHGACTSPTPHLIAQDSQHSNDNFSVSFGPHPTWNTTDTLSNVTLAQDLFVQIECQADANDNNEETQVDFDDLAICVTPAK
jgi:hypothetical protein